MGFKSKIYISGPRMGTNNSMHGIDLVDINKKKSKTKRKKNGSKKRS